MIWIDRSSAALPLGIISTPAAGRGGLYKCTGRKTMASNQGNKQSGNQGNSQSSGTRNRGFASMDPQRQREIASQGGKAAHAKGTAHEFTSEEARRAGSMSHGNRQSAEARSETASRTSTRTGGGHRQSGGGGNKQ
jgi:general stress protein YciG